MIKPVVVFQHPITSELALLYPVGERFADESELDWIARQVDLTLAVQEDAQGGARRAFFADWPQVAILEASTLPEISTRHTWVYKDGRVMSGDKA